MGNSRCKDVVVEGQMNRTPKEDKCCDMLGYAYILSTYTFAYLHVAGGQG